MNLIAVKHARVNSVQDQHLIINGQRLFLGVTHFLPPKTVDGGDNSNFGPRHYFLAFVDCCQSELLRICIWLNQIFVLFTRILMLLSMLLVITPCGASFTSLVSGASQWLVILVQILIFLQKIQHSLFNFLCELSCCYLFQSFEQEGEEELHKCEIPSFLQRARAHPHN